MLRTVTISMAVVLMALAVASGQGLPSVRDVSCAWWLQNGQLARRGESQAEGTRTGYALGVMATAEALSLPQRRGSYIQNPGELVTAIDSLCGSTPQKRLIDVTLYVLGHR
jgi:hypothetical protein